MDHLTKDPDSKLGDALARVPPNARCVVEGGHITIRSQRLNSTIDRQLAGRKDGCYFVAVTGHPDPLPAEVMRDSAGQEDHALFVLLRPKTNEELSLPDRASGVGDVYRVTFEPTTTQLGSLRVALKAARQLRDSVEQVQLAIFIGDLEVPPPLRNSLDWALPEAYQSAISEAGMDADVRLYSEAACRNQGKRRLLDPRKAAFESTEEAERIYREHGFTLVRQDLGGALSLCSDFALELREFPFLVAVTKDVKTPTCGLILAGKLLAITKEGFTHFISVYDEADDARIRRKNIDGFLIFAYLVLNSRLAAILCTLKTVGRLERRQEIDVLSSESINGRGLHGSRQELLYLTDRKNLQPGLHFVGPLSPTDCSNHAEGACKAFEEDSP